MNKIKVMVAESQPIFQRGLQAVLEEQGDMEVVAMVDEGNEAVKMAERVKPDVILMDTFLPTLNGIEVARQIKLTSSTSAILMITRRASDACLLAALQAGVAGYLLRTAQCHEIVSAIRQVLSGEAVIDRRLIQKLFGTLAYQGDRVVFKNTSHGLGEREWDALRLAARGMSNKEIAKELQVSQRTVQTHFSNIFRKLAVGSRTEAVVYAAKQGWLSFELFAE